MNIEKLKNIIAEFAKERVFLLKQSYGI